jgi:hypothetical protein
MRTIQILQALNQAIERNAIRGRTDHFDSVLPSVWHRLQRLSGGRPEKKPNILFTWR